MTARCPRCGSKSPGLVRAAGCADPCHTTPTSPADRIRSVRATDETLRVIWRALREAAAATTDERRGDYVRVTGVVEKWIDADLDEEDHDRA